MILIDIGAVSIHKNTKNIWHILLQHEDGLAISIYFGATWALDDEDALKQSVASILNQLFVVKIMLLRMHIVGI